uniref:C40 family peptidase n=1 Tax=Saccharothrix mutabilis TaxID=33921 RepID=UPI0031D07D69
MTALVAVLFTTPASASVPDGPITRSEVLTRSQSWIDARVPYSQQGSYTNQYGTYRRDCSGYVSMAWHLSTSRWTGNLGEVMHDIPRGDLKPGDALFRHDPAGVQHVALFVGWDDNAMTRPIVREEYQPGRVAEQRVWSASYANTFEPKRYNNIVDDGTHGRPRADHVGDVSGDGYADLLGLKSDGTLHYFPNNINGNADGKPFTSSAQVGVGFGPFRWVRSADVSGDGYADLVGVQSDGSLHYLPNNINTNPEGRPYGDSINIGSGFQVFSDILLADVSGDGYADLLARKSDGTLHYFPNNMNSNPGGRPFTTSTQVGVGFEAFTMLRAGDVSGDGYADLIGVQADGSLHYLPNNINSNPGGKPYGDSINIGSGFQVFDEIVTGDVSGDGYADLMARKSDGTLHYFPNNINSNAGGRPFTTSSQIGVGFDVFIEIV